MRGLVPILLIAALLLGILAPQVQALSEHGSQSLPSGGGMQTSNVRWATKNGVRLTASVHTDSYPRNALVSVWIGLRNLSHRTIYVPGACRGPSNPHVSVLNGKGAAVFPPLIPVAPPAFPPIAACKPALPRLLKPGQALHWRQDAVLRGRRIRAFVGLSNGPRGFLASEWRTVAVPVRLTTTDAPAVTLFSRPPAQVRISGGSGSGPYLASDWWSCLDVMPVDSVANHYLFSVREHVIKPSCAHPTQWHGVVGRLGHSLARFDYVAPATAVPTSPPAGTPPPVGIHPTPPATGVYPPVSNLTPPAVTAPPPPTPTPATPRPWSGPGPSPTPTPTRH